MCTCFEAGPEGRSVKKRKENPWAQEEVVDYVLDSYAGVEENDKGRLKRLFLYADDEGEVWIGNSAAFAEHCAEIFGFELLTYDYVSLNRILIEVGERVMEEKKRQATGESAGQLPMAPERRPAR